MSSLSMQKMRKRLRGLGKGWRVRWLKGQGQISWAHSYLLTEFLIIQSAFLISCKLYISDNEWGMGEWLGRQRLEWGLEVQGRGEDEHSWGGSVNLQGTTSKRQYPRITPKVQHQRITSKGQPPRDKLQGTTTKGQPLRDNHQNKCMVFILMSPLPWTFYRTNHMLSWVPHCSPIGHFLATFFVK